MLPLYIIPTSGLPAPASAAGVILGAASIAALGLIFLAPASTAYFRACRLANVPEELRGQPRPGLGSLFGPKRTAAGRQPAGRQPGARQSAAAARASSAEANRPAAGKAKAKVRSDTDAVAKGAELARSRAKASKSRRSAD